MGFDADAYAAVPERQAQWWVDHPHGAIRVVFLEVDTEAGRYVARADLFRDIADPVPYSVGHAAEQVDPTHPVNRRFALENCETSAIGRALANGGYPSAQDRTRSTRRVRDESSRPAPSTRRPAAPAGRSATGNQVRAIATLIAEREVPDGFVTGDLDTLDYAAAGALIAELQTLDLRDTPATVPDADAPEPSS